MRALLSLLLAGAVVGACVGDSPDPTSGGADAGSPLADGGGSDRDATSASDASDDGTKPSTDGGDASDAASCDAPGPAHVLFFNKGGGTYTLGPDDSRANTTSVVSSTTTANAWSVAAATWTLILDCAKAKLAPFNVTVTDVDPGAATSHVEVVFAQASIEPLTYAPVNGPLKCSAVENAITFVSQTYAENSPLNGCAVAVSSYGAALGLEYVTTCPDAMAFDPSACNTAGFSKTPVDCGTTSAASCTCGTGTKQTSYDEMLAVLGPRCL